MYKQAYQTGPSVSVFSPTGTKPCALWKLSGSVSRSYTKSCLGHAINLGGTSVTRMSHPLSARSALHLTQPFLVLQLFLDPAAAFTLELT
jgi:hypothetical protein